VFLSGTSVKTHIYQGLDLTTLLCSVTKTAETAINVSGVTNTDELYHLK
jgi:hypothetical protein